MAASSCFLDKMIIFKALAKVKAWRRHELWVFLAKHSTHFGRRNHETKIVRMKDAFMKPEACRQCTFGSWGRGCWSCTVWSFSSEKWQKTFSWCIRTLGLIRVKDTHSHTHTVSIWACMFLFLSPWLRYIIDFNYISTRMYLKPLLLSSIIEAFMTKYAQ